MSVSVTEWYASDLGSDGSHTGVYNNDLYPEGINWAAYNAYLAGTAAPVPSTPSASSLSSGASLLSPTGQPTANTSLSYEEKKPGMLGELPGMLSATAAESTAPIAPVAPAAPEAPLTNEQLFDRGMLDQSSQAYQQVAQDRLNAQMRTVGTAQRIQVPPGTPGAVYDPGTGAEQEGAGWYINPLDVPTATFSQGAWEIPGYVKPVGEAYGEFSQANTPGGLGDLSAYWASDKSPQYVARASSPYWYLWEGVNAAPTADWWNHPGNASAALGGGGLLLSIPKDFAAYMDQQHPGWDAGLNAAYEEGMRRAQAAGTADTRSKWGAAADFNQRYAANQAVGEYLKSIDDPYAKQLGDLYTSDEATARLHESAAQAQKGTREGIKTSAIMIASIFAAALGAALAPAAGAAAGAAETMAEAAYYAGMTMEQYAATAEGAAMAASLGQGSSVLGTGYSTGNSAMDQAISKATMQALQTGASGGDIKDILKSAATGAAGSVVSAGAGMLGGGGTPGTDLSQPDFSAGYYGNEVPDLSNMFGPTSYVNQPGFMGAATPEAALEATTGAGMLEPVGGLLASDIPQGFSVEGMTGEGAPLPQQAEQQPQGPTTKQLSTIAQQVMKAIGSSMEPSDAPRRGANESDAEYVQELGQYMNLPKFSGAPGSQEHYKFISDQADEVIKGILGKDLEFLQDAKPEALAAALQGKREEELTQLKRALYVRGQLGTMSFGGKSINPFTGETEEYDLAGAGANPAYAAYATGAGRENEQLANLKGAEARGMFDKLLGRKTDLYGMQARQDADRLRAQLEANGLLSTKKKRTGSASIQDLFSNTGGEDMSSLLSQFGNDGARQTAALEQLLGL